MSSEFDHDIQPPLLDASVHPVLETHLQPEAQVDESDEPLRPINWNLLTSDEAEAEWLDPPVRAGQ
jgi:hypothetical protein